MMYLVFIPVCLGAPKTPVFLSDVSSQSILCDMTEVALGNPEVGDLLWIRKVSHMKNPLELWSVWRPSYCTQWVELMPMPGPLEKVLLGSCSAKDTLVTSACWEPLEHHLHFSDVLGGERDSTILHIQWSTTISPIYQYHHQASKWRFQRLWLWVCSLGDPQFQEDRTFFCLGLILCISSSGWFLSSKTICPIAVV